MRMRMRRRRSRRRRRRMRRRSKYRGRESIISPQEVIQFTFSKSLEDALLDFNFSYAFKEEGGIEEERDNEARRERRLKVSKAQRYKFREEDSNCATFEFRVPSSAISNYSYITS